MFQSIRLPVGIAACIAVTALAVALAGGADGAGTDNVQAIPSPIASSPVMHDVSHASHPSSEKKEIVEANNEEQVCYENAKNEQISFEQYHANLKKYEQYDESLASFLMLVNKELKKDNKEIYTNWLYEDKATDYSDHWGTAFLLWAGEQSYDLVNRGFMPKVSEAAELWNYMTNTNYFVSYEFRTAKQFGISVTAVKVGDFVYPADKDGKIIDVGMVYDVTDDAVTVLYGIGDKLTLTTYTADDFADPNCEMRNAKLQKVIFPKNSSIILDYLLNDMGLCKASAIGILSNMYKESAFSPMRIGDDGTSIGLCQWHGPRWERLAVFCVENGRDECSLMTQLDFLKYELQTHEPDLYSFLKYNIEDSREGAGQAASSFCLVFERPDDILEKAKERLEYAMNYIWYHYEEI